MARIDRSAPTAVYRLFDSDGCLLYVGISINPKARWGMHARDKSWWPEVAEKTIELHPNRDAAEAAERHTIAAEAPKYNVEHSTTRKRGDAMAEYAAKYDRPKQIRIPTDLWDSLGATAKKAGTDRSTLLRSFLAWYIGRPGAELPEQP